MTQSCCAAFCCAVMCCAGLCCAVLCCAVLCCTAAVLPASQEDVAITAHESVNGSCQCKVRLHSMYTLQYGPSAEVQNNK